MRIGNPVNRSGGLASRSRGAVKGAGGRSCCHCAGRPDDKVGLGELVESLSSAASAYFAAGDLGIVIGDGRLNYQIEEVVEIY